MKVIIVGAGLAGSTAARLATEAGFDVTVLDAGYHNTASKAAANLTTHSWAASLGEKGLRGLELLKEHWPVQNIRFSNGEGKFTEAFYVHMDDILWRTPTADTVKTVGALGHVCGTESCYDGTVLLATGAQYLFPHGPYVETLTGHSFIFSGQWSQPLMKLWAPYRHLKVFQWGPDKIWFGDATAIKRENYGQQHVLASLNRARDIGLVGKYHVLTGHRPVVKGHKGYFKRLGESLWISTGGGKNGMILYAAQAAQFVEELKQCAQP